MIASTSQSNSGPRLITYFILTQNGDLYSMGDNNPALTRSSDFTSWMRVKKSVTENLEKVIYVSAQDNDALNLPVVAITFDNNLWA